MTKIGFGFWNFISVIALTALIKANYNGKPLHQFSSHESKLIKKEVIYE